MLDFRYLLGFAFLFAVIGAVLAKRAKINNSKPVFITSVVFAVLCLICIILSVVFIFLS